VPTWKVDPALDVPPSRQLVDAVLDAVASGVLGAGSQLPSVRGMAAEALVNHNTVARAWRDLEHLGVVAGENGRGVFVTAEGPRRARELRRAQTLDAFEQALREALRSGHTLEALQARMKPMERNIA
jgi:GntR family transcriptional regulator